MRLLTLPKKPKLILEFYDDGVVGFTRKSDSITLNDSYIELEFEDIEFLFEEIKKLKKPKRKSYYVPKSKKSDVEVVPTEEPTLPPTESPKKPKRKSYYVPVSQRKKEIPTEAPTLHPTLPPTEAPIETPKKVDFKRELRLEVLNQPIFVYDKVFQQGWGKNVSPTVRYYYRSENASRKASINDVVGDGSGRIL